MSQDSDEALEVLTGQLERSMDDLTPLQAAIATLRFGVGGGPVLSAAEVRKRLQLSATELREEEAEILKVLRRNTG